MTSGRLTDAIVIPVKPLRIAKSRLAPRVTSHERQRLALSMARRVMGAAASTGVDLYVVTVDDEISRAAAEVSAHVVKDPDDAIEYGPGSPPALNAAVAAGALAAMGGGAEGVLIVPADLPHLTSGDLVAAMNRPGREGMVIAPSIDGDGTNALSLPLPLPITLSFGRSSFQLHIHQAIERGIAVRVLRRKGLCHDVDTPSAIEPMLGTGLGG